jgi:multidrug efflux pump
VLSLLVLRAGLVALRALPISEYPEVVAPTIVVRASYPGANPKVIAETVGDTARGGHQRRRGHALMGSQATTDGLVTLPVTFRLGRRRQGAAARTEPRGAGRGAAARGSAPPGTVHRQELAGHHDGGAPVSPNGRYGMDYLRNYALLNVRDRLARIGGVGEVAIWGGGEYAMRVWLSPQKMAQRVLSGSDAVRAIREQNVQAAAGAVGASPGLPGVDLQLSVNAQERLRNEQEFGDIIVKVGADGAVTRLREVARLELGAADYALRSLLNGDAAVGIGVFQAPGSNALDISSRCALMPGTVRRGICAATRSARRPSRPRYKEAQRSAMNARQGRGHTGYRSRSGTTTSKLESSTSPKGAGPGFAAGTTIKWEPHGALSLTTPPRINNDFS